MNGPRIVVDFVADWNVIVRRHLGALGIKVPAHLSDEYVRFAYAGLARRRLRSGPRVVDLAKPFPCPPEERARLEPLLEKIRRGDDITPHQTRNIDRLVNDGLFDDWKIAHLHLGTEIEAKTRFVKRSGPLLYAVFTDAAAHCLGVYPHYRWEDMELLETIHANWPTLIERARLPFKGDPKTQQPTAQELRDARASGIMARVVLRDGTAYLPPGGGYSTAKIANASVSIADRRIERLLALERATEEAIDGLLDEARAAGATIPDGPVALRFDVDDSNGHELLVCDAAGFTWKIPGTGRRR